MEGQQIYLPRLTFINKILIILMGGVFILDFLLSKIFPYSLGSFLALSGQHFVNGHVYSLITYPFVSNSIMEVILNGLMLWLMGSEFEENWGRKRYLKFVFTVILGGAFFFLGIVFLFFRLSPGFALPLMGSSGLVGSFCVAYALIYPTRIFSFLMIIPVQAKYFCMILVAILLFQGVSTPLMVGVWGQLGAFLSGLLFMIVVSNRNFKLLSEKMSSLSEISFKRKSKAKLSIVKNEKNEGEGSPKYWH